MDLPAPAGENGDSTDEREYPNNVERGVNRHSADKIQQLEEFYKDNPNPNENQRRQLSQELGLQPNQIKFWFQNKRSKTKVQDGRSCNAALKAENGQIRHQNRKMKEAMKKIVCRECEGLGYGEYERQQDLQRLRNQNLWLKNEYEKLVSVVSSLFRSRNINPSAFSQTRTTNNASQVPNYPGQGILGGGGGSSEGTSNSKDTLFGIDLNMLQMPSP